MLSGGRTLLVQPGRQMVWSMVAWVTVGLSAPGVHRGSGRESGPDTSAWHDPGGGWAWTTWADAVEYVRPLGTRAERGPREAVDVCDCEAVV
jgi:hypothetical protein